MPQLINVDGFHKIVCYRKYFWGKPYKSACIDCDPTYDSMNECYNAMHKDLNDPNLASIKELIQATIDRIDTFK